MTDKIYIAFCLIAALFFTAVTIPAFAAGAGGSWGNSDGFFGNGGSFGGSGGGGSWEPEICIYDPTASDLTGQTFTSASAAAAAVCSTRGGSPVWSGPPASPSNTLAYLRCSGGDKGGGAVIVTCSSNPEPEPEPCPTGTIRNSSGQCVPELKCPAGYEKQGDKCVWQCPAGFKEVGGSCVPDDQPEDCDPAIQECNDDGTPKCDPCSKLQQLINNNLTMINNDNRVISLTETLVANQNTTNNNINNVNNTLNTVNTNIQNIDNSVQELITTIQENNPTIDTTALENKIDEVINVINNNTGGGGGDGVPTDLQPIIDKMNELNQSIIDSEFDDTTLQSKLDEIINFDITPITDRQDEQIGLLEDIKRLLYPQNEAGDPALDLPEAEYNEVDLWGAIKGFDINQNIINATSECPADKEFTINLGIKTATFAIPMSPMCQYLSYLAPIFLMLAYFSGAMIILKAGE